VPGGGGVVRGGGNKTGRVVICYWKFYFINILHFVYASVSFTLMLWLSYMTYGNHCMSFMKGTQPFVLQEVVVRLWTCCSKALGLVLLVLLFVLLYHIWI
jgi:chromate transport protein ChrA